MWKLNSLINHQWPITYFPITVNHCLFSEVCFVRSWWWQGLRVLILRGVAVVIAAAVGGSTHQADDDYTHSKHHQQLAVLKAWRIIWPVTVLEVCYAVIGQMSVLYVFQWQHFQGRIQKFRKGGATSFVPFPPWGSLPFPSFPPFSPLLSRLFASLPEFPSVTSL